jgi:hypothetical protein
MTADRKSNAPDTWHMRFSGAHTWQMSLITGFPKKLVPGTEGHSI